MTLVVSPSGELRFIYTEALDLSEVGVQQIARASHVEPTSDGHWTADLSPVGGPLLGPFAKRSEALAAEVEWLEAHL